MKVLLDACVWGGALRELAATGHDVVNSGGLTPIFALQRVEKLMTLMTLLIEKLDPVQVNSERASRNVLDVYEIEKELSDLLFAQLIGRASVVASENLYGGKVAFLGLFRVPMQLHVLDHLASQWRHGILLHGIGFLPSPY